MNHPIRRFILCVLLCLLASATVAADYLDSLREATTAIEVGAYNQAGPAIELALAANESDPLVHFTLAALYLHVGRLDNASSEFHEVISLSPDNWRAHYGLAVIALVKGDKAAVEKEITRAGELSPDSPDISAFRMYLDYINGGSPSVPVVASPLGKQIAAYLASKAGDHQTTRELLMVVLHNPGPLGFEENKSPVATFIASAAVALPHGKLSWSPPKKENVPEVSETVRLNADTSRADGVEFVTFFVDGSFLGMSNCEPYVFNWNTGRHPNGLHQIRIDGKDKQGSQISSKTAWVRVRNANSIGNPIVSGPEVDGLGERLWECIRLSECRRLAHYELAKAFLAEGDKESAIRNLEYSIAYRTDSDEAGKMLDKLQGRPMECREVWSVAPGRKRVAVTFDDGPNERTSILLETLAKLETKATFFVVGFRAEAQPELVRAIQAGGHDIENHTYTHPNLATLSTYEIEQQLCKTNAVVLNITGKSPRLFRPPGGNFNNTVRKAAAKHGISGIFWTLNCGPYEGGDPQTLADYVTRNIRDGAIILMHNGEPAAVGALPYIVTELRAQGYELVTVSDLLGMK